MNVQKWELISDSPGSPKLVFRKIRLLRSDTSPEILGGAMNKNFPTTQSTTTATKPALGTYVTIMRAVTGVLDFGTILQLQRWSIEISGYEAKIRCRFNILV